MDLYIRSVRFLSMIFGVAAGLLLVAAAIVVCEMVFIRYVLAGSTAWQSDFITYSIVASTFIGAPYVLMLKGHVNVDIVPLYASHAWRRRMALFAYTVSLVFVALLAWYGFHYWEEALVKRWRTNTVWQLPLWIPLMPLPLGAGMMVLQYVADIMALLTGREEPFGMAPQGHRP